MRQKLSVLLFVFLILSMFVYAEEKTEIPVDELVIKPKIKTSLAWSLSFATMIHSRKTYNCE